MADSLNILTGAQKKKHSGGEGYAHGCEYPFFGAFCNLLIYIRIFYACLRKGKMGICRFVL